MSEARRQFLKLCGSAAALTLSPLVLARRASAQAALDELASKAVKAGETEVVIAGGTGAYGELVKASFYDPFTAATGIKVINAGGSYGEKLAKLKAMAAVSRMEWDIASLSVDSLTPELASLLRDLGDCSALPQVIANGVSGSCVRYGALFDVGGGVMAYSREAFPDGKPQPKSWADFWNVTDFPGPRSLPSIGTPWWVLVAALLADGVPPGKVFPLDLDWAFRKLDAIKPHITVWWRSGDQSQQMFRSKEVVMAMMFSGRATRLRLQESLPINIEWNGAILDAAFWGVMKEAPRPNAAMALINYVYGNADHSAQFSAASFGAMPHKGAGALIPPDIYKVLATNPSNWPGVVAMDRDWLVANQQAVIQRFTEWLAK
jgi:mannopine transport system substrate-binding protein